MAWNQRSAAEMVARGPGPGADPERPPPIGVPEDYRTPGRRKLGSGWGSISVPVSRGPRYFEGDEWVPGSLGSEEIARLQREMAGAGLLTGYRLGVWDAASREAYRDLLSMANSSGMSRQAMLRRLKDSPLVEEGKPPRKPLTHVLSNPDELRAVYQKAAQAIIGRRIDPAEAEAFVAAIHGGERAFQRQRYELDPEMGGTGGGTVFEPTTSEQGTLTAAEAALRRDHPEEAYAEDFGEYGRAFLKLLRSS